MPSPAIRINGGSAGVKASVSASTSVSATLDSTDGVRSCAWTVIGTDETTAAASYTLVQSGSVGQTVTFTSGAAGTAGILRVEINGGMDLQTEQASDATRATCKWYVATSGGSEVGCVNETVESDATYGWTAIVNQGIRGSAVGGISTITAVKTATYTAAVGEIVRCNPSGGAFTVNLPTAVGNGGRSIVVKNVTSSTNAITIDGSASQTIDGATTYDIAEAYGSRTLVSDGANWMIT